jgi:cobalt-zinc-cadmium efflux system membrane fusion protein
MSNDKNLVFVQTKPWTFEPRVVQLGQEDKGEVRVVSGLNPGDKIVVRGGVLLND